MVLVGGCLCNQYDVFFEGFRTLFFWEMQLHTLNGKLKILLLKIACPSFLLTLLSCCNFNFLFFFALGAEAFVLFFFNFSFFFFSKKCCSSVKKKNLFWTIFEKELGLCLFFSGVCLLLCYLFPNFVPVFFAEPGCFRLSTTHWERRSYV